MNKKFRQLTRMLAIILVVTIGFTGIAWAADSEESNVIPELDSGQADPDITYTVREGDTLYQICEDFGLTLNQLMQCNKLTGSHIVPGQVLKVSKNQPTAIGTALSRGNYSREDILLLARLIHAEARGESFLGKVAVGAVILNRLSSPGFPKTIRDVILQRNRRVYQFSPVQDGSINLEPDEASIQAASDAIVGKDPTGGALFFYNPEKSHDRWIRTLPVLTTIGNHVFATKV